LFSKSSTARTRERALIPGRKLKRSTVQRAPHLDRLSRKIERGAEFEAVTTAADTSAFEVLAK
jgi:hypothetical protein